MAINWTLEYENQPRQGSNPGFIANSARTLKTAIRERLSRGHYFGNDEGVDYGKHLEGTAKVFIEDTESAQRQTDGDRITSDAQVGRVKVNLIERATLPQQDGVDVTGDDMLENTVEVWDESGSLVTVFSPDDYVHRDWDLDILGRKRYTSDNPEVQENLTDTIYDAMDTPTQARADEKAVKRLTIKVWTEEAREFNIFDVTDTDNNIIATTGGETNPIDGSTNTTSESISADIIFANQIYGTVYV